MACQKLCLMPIPFLKKAARLKKKKKGEDAFCRSQKNDLGQLERYNSDLVSSSSDNLLKTFLVGFLVLGMSLILLEKEWHGGLCSRFLTQLPPGSSLGNTKKL